ncbi:MAG: DegT/DnrJ/EryC1/StrS family aminotransferase [Rhodospirillales bacterium]|jgi:dTDP-4-amino-4,6-dideoxygalactose transaminase|nr:DegT/DnrJ/EryC1/StrS family aminotransferase [Rhodospirillales bacterium]
MIPFVDLRAQLDSIRADIDLAMAGVMETSSYIRGPALGAFEAGFARLVGADFAFGVGSGTDALHLAVRALGIGPGDEVITVANTWISTAFAASYVGADVVLVDIDPDTYQMDPACLMAAITPKTKAVIPVHLFGHPAPMDEIMAICRPRGIAVIEDVAQAPLAEAGGRQVGTIGDIGCYSFYPSKNLGCFGDGGAVVTNDPALAERLRRLANYGQSGHFDHEMVGYNSRLDTLQAAVLNAKMPHLPAWTDARRRAATWYAEALKDLPVKCPVEAAGARAVYHLYVIQVDDRDECMAYLRDHGVMAQIHYPQPIHLQPCYAGLGYGPGTFPVTEAAAQRILSLPMYAELTQDQIGIVADTLGAFINE